MAKGIFIVIDGTDGSGKSTQTNLLVERLRAEGLPVEMTDFPQYGQKSAGLVEEYLNGKFGTAEEVGPYRGSIFYACDRYAAAPKIREFLAAGKIVVSNRYVSANMGHQTGKISEQAERDKFLDWLDNLEYNIFGIPRPDINILLYMPPEIGQQLVDQKAAREYTNGQKRDIHEADLKHLQNAADAYRYVAEKYNWITINCAPDGELKSIPEIQAMIWEKIKDTIERRKLMKGQIAQAKLFAYTKGEVHPQVTRMIEEAGRTCYQSFDKMAEGTDVKMIQMLLRSGHESVIEHSWFVVFLKSDRQNQIDKMSYVLDLLITNRLLTVSPRNDGYLISGNARMWRDYFRLRGDLDPTDEAIFAALKAATPALFGDLPFAVENKASDEVIVGPQLDFTLAEKTRHFWAAIRFNGGSRAFTHQLVRHRPAAISQESQRYCDEAGFFDDEYFVMPPSIENAGPEVMQSYLDMLKCIDAKYREMQTLTGPNGKRLVLNEDARFLLPNAVCSEIVVSAPIAEWRWLCFMRCGLHAQWEIRDMAMQSLKQLKEVFPDCFADFVIAPDGKSATIPGIKPQGNMPIVEYKQVNP